MKSSSMISACLPQNDNDKKYPLWVSHRDTCLLVLRIVWAHMHQFPVLPRFSNNKLASSTSFRMSMWPVTHSSIRIYSEAAFLIRIILIAYIFSSLSLQTSLRNPQINIHLWVFLFDFLQSRQSVAIYEKQYNLKDND